MSRCSGIPSLGLVTSGEGGGDQLGAREWGWKELSDETEERPKGWARGWERNMGPEIQNVDLGEGGVAGSLETAQGAVCPRTALTVVWSVRAVGPLAGGKPLPFFTKVVSRLLADVSQTCSMPHTTALPLWPALLVVGVCLVPWWHVV